MSQWAKDDALFAREQIEKMIAKGEISRGQGEWLMRLRYPKEKEDPDVQRNPIARCDDD